jgi:hypothetical protein
MACAEPDLTQGVWKRALADFRLFPQTSGWQIANLLTVAAAAVVVPGWTVTGDSVPRQLGAGVATAALTELALVCVALAASVARAPVRQRDEARRAVAALRAAMRQHMPEDERVRAFQEDCDRLLAWEFAMDPKTVTLEHAALLVQEIRKLQARHLTPESFASASLSFENWMAATSGATSGEPAATSKRAEARFRAALRWLRIARRDTPGAALRRTDGA